MPETLLTPSVAQIRGELQELVLRDLLGQISGEKFVSEPYVRDRYMLGALAPRGQSKLPEEDEDLAQAGKDSEEDEVELASIHNHTMLPSSFKLDYTYLCLMVGYLGTRSLSLNNRITGFFIT